MKPVEVNFHLEMFADQVGKLARAHRAVFSPMMVNEIQHLGRNLVRAAWAPPLWNQGLQASLSESTLDPYAGRHRHVEAVRDFLERGPFLVRPDHFIAHLHQVVRVKEAAIGKQGIRDGIQARTRGASACRTFADFRTPYQAWGWRVMKYTMGWIIGPACHLYTPTPRHKLPSIAQAVIYVLIEL